MATSRAWNKQDPCRAVANFGTNHERHLYQSLTAVYRVPERPRFLAECGSGATVSRDCPVAPAPRYCSGQLGGAESFSVLPQEASGVGGTHGLDLLGGPL